MFEPCLFSFLIFLLLLAYSEVHEISKKLGAGSLMPTVQLL